LLEALEQQLQTKPVRHRTLHLAAARDAAECNESLSAVRHALAAKDRVLAMEIAESFVTRLSARGEHGLVRSVLEEVGAPLNAALSGLFGVALIETGASEQGEQLLNSLQTSGNLTPNALFALGKLALRQGDTKKSLEYAINGQKLPGTPLELGRCRRLEGWVLTNLGRLEEAQKCAELEVARAEAEQDLEELAAALWLAARVYALTSQHVPRERSLRRAINVYEQLGNLSDAAMARNNLGNIYRLQGQFEAAKTELERAIADVQNLENEALPYLYDTLGDLLLWQHDHGQARIAYRQAISLAKRLGHSQAVPETQFKLVGAMLHTNEHRAGLAMLEVIEAPHSLDGMRAFMRGLAVFESDPKTALESFQIASEHLESEWLVRTSILQAELFRRTEQLERSHAAIITRNLETHGFDAALFVDVQFTTPTLQFLVQSDWLPSHLNKRILALESRSVPLNRVKLEIQTLGQRCVSINAELVVVHLAKSFELLVFLARNGTSSRDAILEAVWGENNLQSQRYFKVALRRLRADLRVHTAVHFEAVSFNERYALSSHFDTHLDLTQLEVAMNGAVNESLEPILTGIQGEFLPQTSGEWVDEQRELSQELNLLGNIKLGTVLLEREPLRAAEAFRRALMLDPFNSKCLVNLATAFLAVNDRMSAEQAIERYALNLRRDLNLDLDPTTRAQLEAIGL
jgi:LuxR family transcriptional regulator, maltose regulon positive regulatory protein